jgi:hypothetical protein
MLPVCPAPSIALTHYAVSTAGSKVGVEAEQLHDGARKARSLLRLPRDTGFLRALWADIFRTLSIDGCPRLPALRLLIV